MSILIVCGGNRAGPGRLFGGDPSGSYMSIKWLSKRSVRSRRRAHKAPMPDVLQFGRDVGDVMSTRLTRAMTGELDAAEACRMVGEKQLAAVQAQFAFAQAIMNGKAATAAGAYFDVYRRAVKHNRQRLGRRQKRWWGW